MNTQTVSQTTNTYIPRITESMFGRHDASLRNVDYCVNAMIPRTLSKNPAITQYQAHTNMRLLVREDNGAALGCVRAGRYEVVQNSAMIEVADKLSSGGCEVETSFVRRGGEEAYILLRINKPIIADGTDVVHPYVLLYNSFTGRKAFGFAYTALRVCCANQVPSAAGVGLGGSFRHTANGVENWQDAITNAGAFVQSLSDRIRRLVDTPVGWLTMYRIVRECMPKAKPEEHDRIIDSITTPHATNNFNTLPSAWNLANALTFPLGHGKGALMRTLRGKDAERIFSTIERELDKVAQ